MQSRLFCLIIAIVPLAFGCTPKRNNDPDSVTNNIPNNTSTNNVTNGTTGGNNGTNGTNNTNSTDGVPVTLSPEECQANFEVLRTEDVEVRDHPLAHKGDFFGYGDVNGQPGLVSLVDGTPLIARGQPLPGDPEKPIDFFGDRFTVAPDFGDQNEPDFPVVARATTVASNGVGRRPVLLYSDTDGRLDYGLGAEDVVAGTSGPVTLKSFGEFRLDGFGTLFVLADVEEFEDRVLVRQLGPGTAPTVVFFEGQELSTGGAGPRFVSRIESFEPTEFGDVIVRAEIADGAGTVEGFAYLRVSTFDGIQCLATDTAVDCSGVVVNNQQRLEPTSFDSDGATTGAFVIESPTGTFEYRIQGPNSGRGQFEVPNEDVLPGYVIGGVERAEVCSSQNALFFVAQLTVPGDSFRFEELLRIDESGEVRKLTDFRSLLLNEALLGEVPNDIQNFRLGYNCDAILYTFGPSPEGNNQGYEGYWAVYDGGDTVELFDETADRGDGNGTYDDVARRSRSGIDPNADEDALVHIGPDGQFYFIPVFGRASGDLTWNYAVATPPVNRCREPIIVNVEADEPDLSPGDGICDTGEGADGDEACSLRAAIEETNAAPGSDDVRFDGVSNIELGGELPAITSALELDGGGIVTIDGAGLQGDAVGLRVETADVLLRGLTVANFPSHGVEASTRVRVRDVSAVDNCGWGMRFLETAAVSGEPGSTAIRGNGAADGCNGGGVWSTLEPRRGSTLRLAGLEVAENGGPGVLAHGTVDVLNIDVHDNLGDGIVVPVVEGTLGNARLRVVGGDLRVANNAGHGVYVEGGGFFARHSVLNVVENCGWGIYGDAGSVQIYRGPETGEISRNGMTQPAGSGSFWDVDVDGQPTSSSRPCGGGGIAVFDVAAAPDAGSSVAEDVVMRDNQGPGFASTDIVEVSDAQIVGNSGPGILFGELDGASPDWSVVSLRGLTNVIELNLGDGIYVESGSVSVKGGLTLNDNSGAGIATELGTIFVNWPTTLGDSAVERNGLPSRECKPWVLGEQMWEGGAVGACERSEGLYTANGNIRATAATIRENAGAGYRAEDPNAENVGIVTLVDGEVCKNGATNVARVEEISATTNTDCP